MYLRNRAIHDDKVVMRVLPRSEWRGGSTALPSSQSGGEGEAMVTGAVVGIIQRTSREYVATFAVSLAVAISIELTKDRRVFMG